MRSLLTLRRLFVSYQGRHFASRWVRLFVDRFNIRKFAGYNLAFITLSVSLAQPISQLVGFPPEVNAVYPELLIEAVELKTETTLSWPVTHPSVTQTYHVGHPGIDIQGDHTIHPIDRGWVSDITVSNWGYGNHVIIEHPNGRSSLYGHLSTIDVTKGQEVTRESVIGQMGRTGWASGVHVHLEIYQEGKTINPLSILPTDQSS